MGFVPTSCSIGLTPGSVTGGWPFTLLLQEWLFYHLPVGCKGTSRRISRKALGIFETVSEKLQQLVRSGVMTMNRLRLSCVGALPSPPEMGAEMLSMQLALVYPLLFGPCSACGCSDIWWKAHRCKERDFPSCSGIQFAAYWSELAFANLAWLEMLWRSVRVWNKMEL